MIERVCGHCKVQILIKPHKVKSINFCKTVCFNEYRKRKPNGLSTKIKKQCLNCGKDIFVRKAGADRKKFCSRGCHDIYRKGSKREAFSEEHKKNISKSARTRVLTDDGRRKISEARKKQYVEGKAPQMFQKGHEVKAEWREAGRKANIGSARHTVPHREETKEKLRQLKLGTKLTEETKAKLAISKARQGKKKGFTYIEKLLYGYLDNNLIVYEKQHPLGSFVADAFIQHKLLVIEADGTYWHSTPRGIETGLRKDKFIESLGLRMIRIPEVDFNNGKYIKTLNDLFL